MDKRADFPDKWVIIFLIGEDRPGIPADSFWKEHRGNILKVAPFTKTSPERIYIWIQYKARLHFLQMLN